MHKKQTLSIGIGALGAAAVLLSGCGGSSFQKNTFGNYVNTVPAAFGLEAVAANANLQKNLNGALFFETSGLGSVDGKAAFLTAATDFAIVTATDGSKLAQNVDPSATGKVPLGYSAGGTYIDANGGNGVAPTAVATGASAVFRAALANGISANNTPGISASGNTLTSTDPEWTLGTLPLTFAPVVGGPFSNATYVTGTNGTATPFTVPFKTSGVHTVLVTVADDAGRSTATTFSIPFVAAGNVALFLQNITPDNADGTAGKTAQPIPAGDTVTIDGGPGIGVYPATGYNAATGSPSAPTIADGQGTVVLFTTPGAHKIVDASTNAKGVVTTTTQTITVAATPTTIIQ